MRPITFNSETHNWSKSICDCGELSPGWKICIIPSAPRLREYHGRGNGKILGARSQEWFLWNFVSWTWQDHSTHELTAVMVTCVRPVQKQVNQHGGGGAYELLILMEEPWEGEGHCGKKNHFLQQCGHCRKSTVQWKVPHSLKNVSSMWHVTCLKHVTRIVLSGWKEGRKEEKAELGGDEVCRDMWEMVSRMIGEGNGGIYCCTTLFSVLNCQRIKLKCKRTWAFGRWLE